MTPSPPQNNNMRPFSASTRSVTLPRYVRPLRSSLGTQGIQRLVQADALSLPNDAQLIEVLESYFDYVNPSMPLFDRAKVLGIVKSVPNSPVDLTEDSRVSLLALQALLFAGCAVCFPTNCRSRLLYTPNSPVLSLPPCHVSVQWDSTVEMMHDEPFICALNASMIWKSNQTAYHLPSPSCCSRSGSNPMIREPHGIGCARLCPNYAFLISAEPSSKTRRHNPPTSGCGSESGGLV
jgi:hypothetical protein